MKCSDIRERLSAFALGDLDPAAEAVVRHHLDGCEGCRAELEDIRPTLDALRDALSAPLDAPVALSDARRQFLRHRSSEPEPKVVRWFTIQHPWLMAAALLMIGFVFAGLLMPAVSRARLSSQVTGTVNNGRQIFTLLFAEDMDRFAIGAGSPWPKSDAAEAPACAAPQPVEKPTEAAVIDWEGEKGVAGETLSGNIDGYVAGDEGHRRRATRLGAGETSRGWEHGAEENVKWIAGAVGDEVREAKEDASYEPSKLAEARYASEGIDNSELPTSGKLETAPPSRSIRKGSGGGDVEWSVVNMSGLANAPAGQVDEKPSGGTQPASTVEQQANAAWFGDRSVVSGSGEQLKARTRELEMAAIAGSSRYGGDNRERESEGGKEVGAVHDLRTMQDGGAAGPGKSEGRDSHRQDYELSIVTEEYTPADVKEPQALAPDEPFSPVPEVVDSVSVVKSPVAMKGIYGSRAPGMRGSQLQAGGGGASTDGAGSRSLRWLKARQQSDGKWGNSIEDTSVGLLAYLAHGETPASEEFGETTEKAMKALAASQRSDGRFSDDPVLHAKATAAMAEAYSMTKVPVLKDVVDKAARQLVKDGETVKDVSPWQVNALRAVALSGEKVPGLKEAQRAVAEKLKRSSDPVAKSYGLAMLGKAADPEARRSLEQIGKLEGDITGKGDFDDIFFRTQANFHAGGKQWNEWNKQFSPALVKNQTVIRDAVQDVNGRTKDGGYWTAAPEEGGDRKSDYYNTALASLSLQVYYRYLPTFKSPESEEPQEVETSKPEVEIEILDEKPPEPVKTTPEKTPEETSADAKARFKAFGVNPFVNPAENAFSTFSIDVDTASYTIARNYMLKGFLPPAESVRTEEFVNFFDYDYPPPQEGVFAVHLECAPSQFGQGLHLLKIGVKGRRLGREEERGAVLTVLVDTSGSMNTPDRIELARKALRLLVQKLGPKDRIAIVQYDTRARLVLAMTPAADRAAILKAIDGLQCSGSTNIEEGLLRAYQVASGNYRGGCENRVLLLTDGVANLGSTTAADLLRRVEAYRRQGIFCSVFGVGTGTYDDALLEELANKGDGVYRFLDSEEEARHVFVDDLAAGLNTIARDVKIQVEFNPALMSRYRQLGYENRQLKKEDFRNDAVDAGEVGSGQSVTALYELLLFREEIARLKREPAAPVDARFGRGDVVCVVRVRYRRTDTGRVEEIERKLTASELMPRFADAPVRFRLAAGVAEFAEILRGSPFADGSDFSEVADVLRPVSMSLGLDARISELQRLAEAAGGMSRGL